MAKQYDNTNRASVWGNENFIENEAQPALRVKMNVDGEDKEVSFFVNERHDAAGDIIEILQELLEIVAETESSSPIFTGKVDLPYAVRKAQGEGGGGGGRSGRKSRRGGRKAAEQTDAGDTW